MVVQPRPAQLGVGQVEPQRTDQVQVRPGGRHEPDRVAGVRRDARLVEGDVEHGVSLPRRRPPSAPRARCAPPTAAGRCRSPATRAAGRSRGPSASGCHQQHRHPTQGHRRPHRRPSSARPAPRTEPSVTSRDTTASRSGGTPVAADHRSAASRSPASLPGTSRRVQRDVPDHPAVVHRDRGRTAPSAAPASPPGRRRPAPGSRPARGCAAGSPAGAAGRRPPADGRRSPVAWSPADAPCGYHPLCWATLTTVPSGARTKNRRTPQGSVVNGCTIS